jgi:hypothetical protein
MGTPTNPAPASAATGQETPPDEHARRSGVRSFDHPPRYEAYDTPEPAGTNETLVGVLAVGLHPRVRTGASGRHYTSTGTLPMIPGIDGVGRLPERPAGLLRCSR